MNPQSLFSHSTRLVVSLFFAVSVVTYAGCGDRGGNGSDEIPQFVSVGTAPQGGTFFLIGAAIANTLDEGAEAGGWKKVTAESTGGSLENFRRLDSKEVQLAMANSSITYFAVRGEGGFDKKYDLKSVMTLFPLIGMFVTKQGSGVETIGDFRGKRIVVGPPGAGFEYFLKPILKAHGISYDDFEDRNAGMGQSVGYLQDESIKASFLAGGMQSPSITAAATSMDILLIPYGEKQRSDLVAEYPSFGKVTVPANTYKGQTEPFESLNVGSAHLIVRGDARDELVYRMTKIIYEGRANIAESHRAGKAINAKNVVRKTGTPFHPGAVRYYKEIGIWPDDEPSAKTGT